MTKTPFDKIADGLNEGCSHCRRYRIGRVAGSTRPAFRPDATFEKRPI
jgi:hypothetical protein